MEEWSEKKISTEALKQAIATTHENKKLLKQIATFRASASAAVSGVDALKIIGSSMVMMKSEHNPLLKIFLEEALEKLPPKKGTRVFVSGSPQDHTQIYEDIESTGAVIVGEDQ